MRQTQQIAKLQGYTKVHEIKTILKTVFMQTLTTKFLVFFLLPETMIKNNFVLCVNKSAEV